MWPAAGRRTGCLGRRAAIAGALLLGLCQALRSGRWPPRAGTRFQAGRSAVRLRAVRRSRDRPPVVQRQRRCLPRSRWSPQGRARRGPPFTTTTRQATCTRRGLRPMGGLTRRVDRAPVSRSPRVETRPAHPSRECWSLDEARCRLREAFRLQGERQNRRPPALAGTVTPARPGLCTASQGLAGDHRRLSKSPTPRSQQRVPAFQGACAAGGALRAGCGLAVIQGDGGDASLQGEADHVRHHAGDGHDRLDGGSDRTTAAGTVRRLGATGDERPREVVETIFGAWDATPVPAGMLRPTGLGAAAERAPRGKRAFLSDLLRAW